MLFRNLHCLRNAFSFRTFPSYTPHRWTYAPEPCKINNSFRMENAIERFGYRSKIGLGALIRGLTYREGRSAINGGVLIC